MIRLSYQNYAYIFESPAHFLEKSRFHQENGGKFKSRISFKCDKGFHSSGKSYLSKKLKRKSQVISEKKARKQARMKATKGLNKGY